MRTGRHILRGQDLGDARSGGADLTDGAVGIDFDRDGRAIRNGLAVGDGGVERARETVVGLRADAALTQEAVDRGRSRLDRVAHGAVDEGDVFCRCGTGGVGNDREHAIRKCTGPERQQYAQRQNAHRKG
jgi:hypothetical protein